MLVLLLLQNRFHFIAYPCKLWNNDAIQTGIMGCFILHNMIIEDEWWEELENIKKSDNFQVEEYTRGAATIDFQQNRTEIMSSSSHYNLKDDLVEHLWKFKHDKL